MKLPVLYILTHDSIGVGEDGPTHQPIEHLASIRAIPDTNLFRPADQEGNRRGLYCRPVRYYAHRAGAYPPEPAPA